MTRHGFDPKITDFTWKQNRLSKDKEALKNSVLNIISKKPKVAADANEDVPMKVIPPVVEKKEDPVQFDQKREETKKIGGRGMVASGQYVKQVPKQEVNGRGAIEAVARPKPQAIDGYASMNNKRGTEFKKSAQQMLNK